MRGGCQISLEDTGGHVNRIIVIRITIIKIIIIIVVTAY